MREIVRADLQNPKHCAALLGLLDEYASHDMGGGGGLNAEVRTGLIPALQARCGVHIVLAFEEGNPAGLAICFEGFSTFACKPLLNIHDIVVSAAFRGRGLSKALLAKVEEIARELGCCKLTLEVLEGNALALAAYSSFGFSAYQLKPENGRALFWQKPLS